MSELPIACVIGAGSSGIAAAKVLHERGVPFDCFEKSDRVGGLWVFGNRNGMSSAYRSLHANTSKPVMSYSDFPLPDHVADFPHHTDVARYFDDYVDHFGFRDRIEFETVVEQVTRRPDGVWEVTLDTGETREYDAVLVANGHHWDPRWPEPPFRGHFDGTEMHSHDYVDARAFEDKRVVVVGMGNSAMDIAVDASFVADRVFLSARRGAHIIPHYVMGKPMDQYPNNPYMPFRLRRHMAQTSLRFLYGKPEKFGLPKPDHKFGEAAPTISSYILPRIAQHEVTPKPNIAELQGERVRFADGSVERVDVVVYCTGYRVTFPFFHPDFISAPNNDLPLYKRVFKYDLHDVFFIGLVQPWGATMPLAESQSRLVVGHLIGEYALPTPEQMRRDIERDRARMFKRYVTSKRHTLMVDGPDYLLELEREMAKGTDRARERGNRLPIPPRARSGGRAPAPLA